jgi:ATP-dependent Clp protease ATP-binding subunit ClpA
MGARLDDVRAVAEPAPERGQAERVSGEPRDRAWRGLTSHARRVLERSLEEALNRGEGYIGVEHLLLAVLRDSRGGAVRALRRVDVDPREVVSRLSQV